MWLLGYAMAGGLVPARHRSRLPARASQWQAGGRGIKGREEYLFDDLPVLNKADNLHLSLAQFLRYSFESSSGSTHG